LIPLPLASVIEGERIFLLEVTMTVPRKQIILYLSLALMWGLGRAAGD
jgi:hypothetical protein